MSNFIIDNLGKQIERGEWFFTGQDYVLGSFDPGDTIKVNIAVSTKPCQCLVSVSSGTSLGLSLYEGATISGGSSKTLYNMNRDSANTISTTLATSGIASGGTNIGARFSETGDGQILSPFNYETGLILAASTDYSYWFNNSGAEQSTLALSFFLREL